jgi:hypothetical protein
LRWLFTHRNLGNFWNYNLTSFTLKPVLFQELDLTRYTGKVLSQSVSMPAQLLE